MAFYLNSPWEMTSRRAFSDNPGYFHVMPEPIEKLTERDLALLRAQVEKVLRLKA